MPLAIQARHVFPVTAPPLIDAAVVIEGDRVVAVGEPPAGCEIRDLGTVAILPGLVNCHTHLEFSDLHHVLGWPEIGFTEWIQRVIEFRHARTVSVEHVIRRGLAECTRSGTTALGEIAQPGWPADPFDRATLEAVVFLELLAPVADRLDPTLAAAESHAALAGTPGRWRPGLSPHAPYTVLETVLQRAVSMSHRGRIPLAMHLAESREEIELLASGTGSLADFLRQRQAAVCPHGRPATKPLDFLRELAHADRALVIHGNYLGDEEMAFLAARSENMAVVYCPRTHAFFGHQRYPLEKMLAMGVTVALGTDSRASNPDLSLLAEMRFVARRYPGLSRATILQLGTLSGAKALGLREIGRLEPGACADLAVVAIPDDATADPYELLLAGDLPVVATWFRGQQVFVASH